MEEPFDRLRDRGEWTVGEPVAPLPQSCPKCPTHSDPSLERGIADPKGTVGDRKVLADNPPLIQSKKEKNRGNTQVSGTGGLIGIMKPSGRSAVWLAR